MAQEWFQFNPGVLSVPYSIESWVVGNRTFSVLNPNNASNEEIEKALANMKYDKPTIGMWYLFEKAGLTDIFLVYDKGEIVFGANQITTKAAMVLQRGIVSEKDYKKWKKSKLCKI